MKKIAVVLAVATLSLANVGCISRLSMKSQPSFTNRPVVDLRSCGITTFDEIVTIEEDVHCVVRRDNTGGTFLFYLKPEWHDWIVKEWPIGDLSDEDARKFCVKMMECLKKNTSDIKLHYGPPQHTFVMPTVSGPN